MCYFLYKFLKKWKDERFWFPQVDFPHTENNPNTLEYIQSATIGECIGKCQNDMSCNAVVTSFLKFPQGNEKGQCWLKSNMDNASFSTKFTSFKKTNKNGKSEFWVVPMDYPHTTSNPNTLQHIQNTDSAGCIHACMKNNITKGKQKCYGIVTSFSGMNKNEIGDCWLKSNFNNPTISKDRYALRLDENDII